MEEVPARLAALVRHLLVGADDAVADGALRLPLHRADDVAPEGRETVDYAPALAVVWCQLIEVRGRMKK